MSSHSIETSAQTVSTIALKAVEDAAQIVGLIELLEASNRDGINNSLNAAKAGGAALQVRFSLIWRLQLLVARAYAKPTKSGDLHLRRAFELLEDNGVRQKVLSNNADRIRELHEAKEGWKKLRGDHRLQKIEHARHKFIAHLGEPDKEVESRNTRSCSIFPARLRLLWSTLHSPQEWASKAAWRVRPRHLLKAQRAFGAHGRRPNRADRE